MTTRSTIWAKQCTANMLTQAPPSPRSCTSLEPFLMLLAPSLTQATQRLIWIPSQLYRPSTAVTRVSDTSSRKCSNSHNISPTRPFGCSKRTMTTNHSSQSVVASTMILCIRAHLTNSVFLEQHDISGFNEAPAGGYRAMWVLRVTVVYAGCMGIFQEVWELSYCQLSLSQK